MMQSIRLPQYSEPTFQSPLLLGPNKTNEKKIGDLASICKDIIYWSSVGWPVNCLISTKMFENKIQI